ncbi:MAG: hypothetical protein GY786_02805 [Proteobacteria bacterium]|nr:hypothetical protein [Pseudomonadota bacterium]
MKSLKSLFFLFLVLILGFGFMGCKRSSDTKDNDLFTEIAEEFAKFMGWNLNKNSRVQGVFITSLSASQALPPLINLDGLKGVRSNGNKNLSWVSNFSDGPVPSIPQAGAVFHVNGPFLDGSYLEAFVSGANLHPVAATEYTKTHQDASGNTVNYGSPYEKWTATFGGNQLNALTYTVWDPSTDQAYTSGSYDWYQKVETYAANPVSDYNQSDYRTGTKWYDVSGDLLAERVVTISGTTMGDYSDTKECYGSAGAAGGVIEGTTNCSLSTPKQVNTYNLSGNLHTSTTQYFDASGNEISTRGVVTSTYENYALRHSSSTTSEYFDLSSDGTTATLNFKTSSTSTHGKVTSYTYYDVSSDGTATAKLNTSTATLNNQRRYTEQVRRDTTGDIHTRFVYEYDTQGNLSSTKAYYTPTGGTEESDPYCGASEDIYPLFTNRESIFDGGDHNTYASTIAWANTSTGTSRTVDYYCDGNSIAENPVSRHINEYNSNGQKTAEREYNCSGTACETATLSSQNLWEFNSDLTTARQLYYSVDGSGDATPNGYTRFFQDSNLFPTHWLTYDASDNVTTSFPREIKNYTYQ